MTKGIISTDFQRFYLSFAFQLCVTCVVSSYSFGIFQTVIICELHSLKEIDVCCLHETLFT